MFVHDHTSTERGRASLRSLRHAYSAQTAELPPLGYLEAERQSACIQAVNCNESHCAIDCSRRYIYFPDAATVEPPFTTWNNECRVCPNLTYRHSTRPLPSESHMMWKCVILVATQGWLCWLYTAEAASSDPLNYAACPERHHPEFYCCEIAEGVRELFTKFNRPRGGDYEKEYERGWNTMRQVNFPYEKYTPSSPPFYYNDSATVCRVQSIVVNRTSAAIDQELQCTTTNTSLALDSLDSTVFWTSRVSPRNSNASFPVGARCYSLMLLDGSVNTVEKDACVSSSVQEPYRFASFVESELVAVYALYLLCFLFLFVWSAFKRQAEPVALHHPGEIELVVDGEGGQQSSGNMFTRKSRYMRLQHPACIPEETTDNGMDVIQVGYKRSTIGVFVLAYFCLASVGLHASVVVVILDYYDQFHPALFDPSHDNALMFFLTTVASAMWSSWIVLCHRELRNFFRLRCDLGSCEFVDMIKCGDTEIQLADRTGVSRFIARVERLLFRCGVRGKVRTHREIVRVACIGQHRIVDFQYVRYVYDENKHQFLPGSIEQCESSSTYATLIAKGVDGLDSQEAERRMSIVGPNAIDVTVPSMWTSLSNEFFSLFYVYQITCYYVWYYFTYWNMAAVMTAVVLGTAVVNIHTKRQMQRAIVVMTRYRSDVTVLRSREWTTVDSASLVPGDVIKVAENWVLPCDLAILKGSTVCDESMLTGESMPVQKFPLPDDNASGSLVFDPERQSKKHTLFAGTRVLASGRSEHVIGIVQATGAHTTKGQLVQSILYPAPMRFKYDEHLKALIILLLIYSTIACYFGLGFLVSNGKMTNKMTAFCYSIFMISAVVNPLLPVVVTVGQVSAARRLENAGVFSLNAQRITLFGKVRVFCFDKTGTLTKQGMDFLGVRPVRQQTFQALCTDLNELSASGSMLQFALATCHSVGSLDGCLVGNEVEVQMFLATGWKLIEKEGSAPVVQARSDLSMTSLELVKRFEFDHHRMSMSVVVRHCATGRYYVFCKGSYERMQSLSDPSSVPSEYKHVADQHAKEGCYVLGVAYRELPHDWTASQVAAFIDDRGAVDENLSLLGLILFRNELKTDTRSAIAKLKTGNVRTVMITGDNAMCGCYIARQCGMVSEHASVILGEMNSENALTWYDIDNEGEIDLDTLKERLEKSDQNYCQVELAVTGPAFDHLNSSGELKSLLFHVRIFSRMTPDGKVECVKLFMDADVVTGMCGDGGNDCGALRIAHAGVALSDAEASVVSPFTSRLKSIQSVVDLCCEGRCSLATSFASVKFLIMYGVIASTLRLFQWYHAVIMSEWCFILADGLTLVGLSYTITLARPLPELGEQRPTSSLIGPTTLASIIGQEIINASFLAIGITLLTNEQWYCPFTPANIDLAKWWLLSDNHMATTLFFTIITQQQLSAWVFSFGSRFRAPVWHNYGLVALISSLAALDLYLMLGEPSQVTDLFRIASGTNVVGLPYIPMPSSFRFKYLVLLIWNIIAVILFESVVVLGPVRDYLRRRYHTDTLSLRV